ncbi:AlpA family transcriptional regulator [Paraburkholderia bryophila]|uniref:helix-turn-helix transcriptional regulator n=1 Tax=Paraburkholderia bryophila TaxID=420952 RepID=UPI0038BBB91E
MSEKKERLIRLEEVMNRTALTRSLLYKLVDAGEFPKGVKLCSSAVAWPESEVDKWIAARIEAAKQE